MKNRFAGAEGLTAIAARYVRGLPSPFGSRNRQPDNILKYLQYRSLYNLLYVLPPALRSSAAKVRCPPNSVGARTAGPMRSSMPGAPIARQ
jgi:hypothetical protein